MKILRIIAAMVLALLAALLMWGEVGLILEHEKLPIIQHLSAFAIALGFAASALYFSRSTSYWASNLSCPHCSQRATLSLSAFPQPRIRSQAPARACPHPRPCRFSACDRYLGVASCFNVATMSSTLWFNPICCLTISPLASKTVMRFECAN